MPRIHELEPWDVKMLLRDPHRCDNCRQKLYVYPDHFKVHSENCMKTAKSRSDPSAWEEEETVIMKGKRGKKKSGKKKSGKKRGGKKKSGKKRGGKKNKGTKNKGKVSGSKNWLDKAWQKIFRGGSTGNIKLESDACEIGAGSTSVPKSEHPWLLTSYRNKKKHSFYSLSKSEYYTNRIWLLSRKTFVDSYRGWLVVTSKYNVCVWNPSSDESIDLPKLKYPHLFVSCVLSKRPKRRNCCVLFNSIGGGYQAFCKVGDDKYIINRSVQRDVFLVAALSFKGKIYGIIRPDLVFVIVHVNFDEGVLEFEPLLKEDGETWKLDRMLYSSPWVVTEEQHLVKSVGNEILLVHRMWDGDETEFRVFRADFLIKEFVEMEDLGNQSIFLSSNGGGFCCSTQGIQQNCIYYTVEGSRELYIYDLKSYETTSRVVNPNSVRGNFKMFWLPHNIFLNFKKDWGPYKHIPFPI